MAAKNLVIVESPAKTKSIGKYLGRKYKVVSSMGHVVDLPKSKLGVDTDHNYTPEYTTLRGKGKVIKALKKAAKNMDHIYLATDLDREGEAIAWHIVSVLGGLNEKQRVKDEKKFKRVSFSEITQDAITAAFNTPREFDYDLVDAYQARRVLDRLVGYKLSPLLWKKIQYGLSAGRVQSVALRLVVEREKERKAFKSKPYHKIEVVAGKAAESLTANLTQINGKYIDEKTTLKLFAGKYTYTQTVMSTKKMLDKVLKDLKSVSKLKVKQAKSNASTKKPSAPFTTSTLQRSASTRLSLSPKRTMRLAQKLYEEGYITYHRTDSQNLAQQFMDQARQEITATFGKEYLSEAPIIYKSKQKNTQEAHEAIRPTKLTDPKATHTKIKNEIDGKSAQLYDLIYNRAVSSQMRPAIYQKESLVLIPGGDLADKYTFSAHGSILTFDGFLRLWGRDSEDRNIPKLKEGDLIELTKVTPTDHMTSPPPRYNAASIIKDLEEHGIGRPSTYAPIIDTIQSRNYVNRNNGALFPTDFGYAVTSLLTDHFEKIVDLKFTASMEDKLDRIADGKADWKKFIDEFYRPFEKKIIKKEHDLERSDYKIIKKLDEKCPECKHHLVLKLGRYGKFYSCSNFPECKYAKPYIEKIGMACPNCGGDIIIRHTRFGKVFYGCRNYPKCEWASWDDPRRKEEESDE